MICSGQNVTHFPTLNESRWVSHIDVLNTNITHVSSFNIDQWVNLHTLDIRDNLLLSCINVSAFQKERPDLIIITDCDDNIIREDIYMYPNTLIYNHWYLLLLVPLALLILFVYMQTKPINIKHCHCNNLIEIMFACSSIHCKVIKSVDTILNNIRVFHIDQ